MSEKDLEGGKQSNASVESVIHDSDSGSRDCPNPEPSPTNHEAKDIEHVYVQDDPRKWSRARKVRRRRQQTFNNRY